MQPPEGVERLSITRGLGIITIRLNYWLKVYFRRALRLFYLQELPSPIIRFHEGIDYFRTPPSVSCKMLTPAIVVFTPHGNASPSEGATTPIPTRWNRYGSFYKSSGRAPRPEGRILPSSLSTPTVVRDGERGNLAGWFIPARSALSGGVWCVWVAYLQCRSGYATRF